MSGPGSGEQVRRALPRLVDSHCHLDEPVFDADRARVLAAARAAGADRLINIGYRPGRWSSTAALTAEPGVDCTFGVHPQHADEWSTVTEDTLRGQLAHPRARALGEIGLDYVRDGPPAVAQRRAFADQLALAVALDVPVVIHQRAAEDDLMDVLARSAQPRAVVLHSFDGSHRLAAFALDRGYRFGVGGLITRTGSANLRKIVAELPLERLLLETDSPYLTPSGVKDRRNQPANVARVAAFLADLKRASLDEIATTTTANAEAVFGLRDAGADAGGG